MRKLEMTSPNSVCGASSIENKEEQQPPLVVTYGRAAPRGREQLPPPCEQHRGNERAPDKQHAKDPAQHREKQGLVVASPAEAANSSVSRTRKEGRTETHSSPWRQHARQHSKQNFGPHIWQLCRNAAYWSSTDRVKRSVIPNAAAYMGCAAAASTKFLVTVSRSISGLHGPRTPTVSGDIDVS